VSDILHFSFSEMEDLPIEAVDSRHPLKIRTPKIAFRDRREVRKAGRSRKKEIERGALGERKDLD